MKNFQVISFSLSISCEKQFSKQKRCRKVTSVHKSKGNQNNAKRKKLDFQEAADENISSLVKNLNTRFSKRADTVPIDNDYHFAISVAGDLRNLQAREKCMAKNEIRNVLYQMMAFNYTENVPGNNFRLQNNLPIPTVNYGTPVPPSSSNIMRPYSHSSTPNTNFQNIGESNNDQNLVDSFQYS